LGKVLWWMVSGKPIKELQFWYFDHDDLNVERLHAEEAFIDLINPILAKCVVQFENKCRFDSATELLSEIDKALKLIEHKVDPLSDDVQRTCRVCALGTYVETSDRDRAKTEAFGLCPEKARQFKIYQCGNCGNVQAAGRLADCEKKARSSWLARPLSSSCFWIETTSASRTGADLSRSVRRMIVSVLSWR
jgi:hypothetical protein